MGRLLAFLVNVRARGKDAAERVSEDERRTTNDRKTQPEAKRNGTDERAKTEKNEGLVAALAVLTIQPQKSYNARVHARYFANNTRVIFEAH